MCEIESDVKKISTYAQKLLEEKNMVKFHSQALQKAEDVYNRVELKADQRAIVVALSKVMCSGIPMKELPMRGFMLQAIKKWQEENHMKIGDLMGLEVTKKLQYVRAMLGEVQSTLVKVLHDPADESKIASGVVKAWETYKRSFAQR